MQKHLIEGVNSEIEAQRIVEFNLNNKREFGSNKHDDFWHDTYCLLSLHVANVNMLSNFGFNLVAKNIIC
jgi:hypothetical protein